MKISLNIHSKVNCEAVSLEFLTKTGEERQQSESEKIRSINMHIFRRDTLKKKKSRLLLILMHFKPLKCFCEETKKKLNLWIACVAHCTLLLRHLLPFVCISIVFDYIASRISSIASLSVQMCTERLLRNFFLFKYLIAALVSSFQSSKITLSTWTSSSVNEAINCWTPFYGIFFKKFHFAT